MHSGCHKEAESWRSDTWKVANVTPIFKSGSKNVSIFRHISEISIFYEILGWIVNHQLRNFVLTYSAIRIIHLLCKASKGGLHSTATLALESLIKGQPFLPMNKRFLLIGTSSPSGKYIHESFYAKACMFLSPKRPIFH